MPLFNRNLRNRNQQLEQLVKLLSARDLTTMVPIPRPEDIITAMASLATNKNLLYYFSEMRKDIIDEFMVGGTQSPDYYRGKLAAIAEIQEEARSARDAKISLS